MGRPWEWGKAFDQSAPMAPVHPVSDVGHPAKGRIWLAVNGDVKQDQDIADLIWSVPEIIAYASNSMRLEAGDLIMTGTRRRCPIVAGDVVTGGVAGLTDISVTFA